MELTSVLGYIAAIGAAAFIARVIFWRFQEKSHKFSAFTSSEEAINGEDLTGQVAVVTGCNAGIGKETARVLVKQGCQVFMACRSVKKATAAKDDIVRSLKLSESDASSRLIVMECDLSSLESVKQFCNAFNQKKLAINYLILNAGIMALPAYKETKDGVEMQFGTNHLGHFYLTKLLMPSVLRANSSEKKFGKLPRVISLSSLGHFYLRDWEEALKLFDDCIKSKNFMGARRNDYDAWFNYGISKACNILFARELQKRHKKELVAVSLHPGAVNTELSRHMTIWDGLRFMAEFMQSPMDMVRNMKSIPEGAATTLRCVSMTEDEIQPGHYYYNCRSGDDAGELTNACLQDKMRGGGKLAQKLWQLSEVILESKGFE